MVKNGTVSIRQNPRYEFDRTLTVGAGQFIDALQFFCVTVSHGHKNVFHCFRGLEILFCMALLTLSVSLRKTLLIIRLLRENTGAILLNSSKDSKPQRQVVGIAGETEELGEVLWI